MSDQQPARYRAPQGPSEPQDPDVIYNQRRYHSDSDSSSDDSGSDTSSDTSSGGDPNEFQTPEQVKQFLEDLQRGLDKHNIKLLTELYEEKFSKLTEQYFKTLHWPTTKFASEFLNTGLPMCLYKELTIRHILTNLQSQMKLSDYIDSWHNSVEIMRIISHDLDQPTVPGKVQLPPVWLWDLMDEFVYHYQKFQQYRAKTNSNRKEVADKEDEEKLKKNKDAWDSGEVINLLEEIARKSKVDLYLQKVREGKKDDRDLPCESARLVGYYAKVQLLRVHSLHGEYLKGLRAVNKLDLRLSLPLPLYCTSASCHVTLFYYLGFAYMMMQRYYDATQTFTHILLFLAKSRMTAQYQDLMQQKIFHLLLMCVTLCPSSLDEVMGKIVSEKYAEVHYKMQQTLANRDEEADFRIFEEKFSYSCPKFITPYFAEKDFCAPPNEMHKSQLETFLHEVKSMRMLPTLTSFMKLYTTISLEKLRRFCEVDMDTLHVQMDALKQKSIQLVHVPDSEQGPVYGEERNCGDIDFRVEDDKVHVMPIKKEVSHTQVFLKSISEMQEIIKTLESGTGVEAY